jgi:hypothetical protein
VGTGKAPEPVAGFLVEVGGKFSGDVRFLASLRLLQVIMGMVMLGCNWNWYEMVLICDVYSY